MRITILCSSENHPVNKMLQGWIRKHQTNHEISLVRSKSKLTTGDVLFLISCGEIITTDDREKFTKSLVIHASDLPRGRGWSPHVWEILGGAEEITVSLLEAEDNVDTGAIWKKVLVDIPKNALFDEINELLFRAESELMDFAVDSFSSIQPQSQNLSMETSYFRLRTPTDSELDPSKSIESQFNLLRVCDPNRFPGYFRIHGHRYKVKLEKMNDD